MRKISLLLVCFLLLTVVPMGSVQAEDYSVWQYHKVLTISGNTTSIPAGYQINFTLYKGAGTDSANIFYLNNHAENDLSDLRFVDGEGTLLDMWNETTITANHVHVWIELASSLTVIMYYGNEYADSEWDAASTIFESIMDTGIVLSLPLNEGSGSAATDYSGNANTGAITGAEWATTGNYGSGIYFDGTNDFINCGDGASLDLTGTYSLTAWIKHEPQAGYLYMRGTFQTNGIIIGIADTGYIDCYTSQAAAYQRTYTVSVLAESAWRHLAVVRNDTSIKIYINGAEAVYAAQGTHIDPATSNADSFIAQATGGTSRLDGTLEMLNMFNVSLSQAQITELANTEHYPQSSAANPGNLFFREFLADAPTIAAGLEINSRDSPDYTAIYTFGLFAVLAITLLLFKFGVPILNLVFGIVALGLVAATIGSEYVVFAPYLQLGVALTAVMLMLHSANRGLRH